MPKELSPELAERFAKEMDEFRANPEKVVSLQEALDYFNDGLSKLPYLASHIFKIAKDQKADEDHI